MKYLLISALSGCEFNLPKPKVVKKVYNQIPIQSGNVFELRDMVEELSTKTKTPVADIEVDYSETMGCLVAYIPQEVDKTEEEIEKEKIAQFNRRAWTYVYEVLTKFGYKRTPCSTSKFKEFDDTTVFDMYKNKEYDRLVEYYSLRFKRGE